MPYTHPTILIVEDQPDLVDLLQFFLHRKGYNVDTAADGREALNKLHGGFNPCIILLDLMMPVMDGPEFRQEQLRHPHLADIPVIVCSGVADLAKQAQGLGAKAHIKKPVDLSDVFAAVQAHCLK